jgi:hypothetical protein
MGIALLATRYTPPLERHDLTDPTSYPLVHACLKHYTDELTPYLLDVNSQLQALDLIKVAEERQVGQALVD